MKTPQKGQTVYTYRLQLDNPRTGKPSAVIRPRQFDHRIDNYLGKFGERWALKPLGKPDSYATACNPKGVFLTEKEAVEALNGEISRVVEQLIALKGGAK